MPAAKDSGKPAIDLLEEAVHLLRGLAAGTWVTYYVGTLPFVLGALYFWSDMSGGSFARAHLLGYSLLLALLFVWMKVWQGAACAQMEARMTGEPPPRWSARRIWRVTVVQAALQPLALIALPVAALITLPLAWVQAYFQNAVVLDRGETLQPGDVSRSARAMAQLWPMQNHVGLSVVAIFALFVGANLGILMLATPFLLRTLLGIETAFSRGIFAMLNTTFLASVCGATYLVIDPIVKAFYLLRCFYGRSLRSGEDLRAALRRIRSAALLLLAGLLLTAPALAAEDAGMDPVQLDRSIQETLDQPEFSWRLPREKATDEPGLLGNFVLEIKKGFIELIVPLKDRLKDLEKWLEDWFKPKDPEPAGEPFDFFQWVSVAEMVVYGLSILAVLIAVWLLWKRWRQTRHTVEAESVAVAARPDLAAEETLASELPEDEWLRLAGEMVARQEYRLAFRAYYLAGLAHLGGRGLLTIARHKSNREYERELARRARQAPEKQRALHDNVTAFERVWYGRHPALADDLPLFSGNLEELRRP